MSNVKKRKKAERVGDFVTLIDRLYYLRTSPTFATYLERVGEMRKSEEYRRLTNYNAGRIEVMFKQCSPSLATDYTTGIRGWGNATVSAYRYLGDWAVYNGDGRTHTILSAEDGSVLRTCDSSKVYASLHAVEGGARMETVWRDCPFRRDLNGKAY